MSIETEGDLRSALEALGTLYRGLDALKSELRDQPARLRLLAEGPLDELQRLEADLRAYAASFQVPPPSPPELLGDDGTQCAACREAQRPSADALPSHAVGECGECAHWCEACGLRRGLGLPADATDEAVRLAITLPPAPPHDAAVMERIGRWVGRGGTALDGLLRADAEVERLRASLGAAELRCAEASGERDSLQRRFSDLAADAAWFRPELGRLRAVRDAAGVLIAAMRRERRDMPAPLHDAYIRLSAALSAAPAPPPAADTPGASRLVDLSREVEGSRTASLTGAVDTPRQLAVDMILSERVRQLERWSIEHDEDHFDGSLASAAAAYALSSTASDLSHSQAVEVLGRAGAAWPWEADSFRPRGVTRSGALLDLARAGALIVAEIERRMAQDPGDAPLYRRPLSPAPGPSPAPEQPGPAGPTAGGAAEPGAHPDQQPSAAGSQPSTPATEPAGGGGGLKCSACGTYLAVPDSDRCRHCELVR